LLVAFIAATLLEFSWLNGLRALEARFSDLFVAAQARHTRPDPGIVVIAADEVRNFKRKVDAGANSAITQYFYNADAYVRFVDECAAAGITVPIVPGIMPIGNFSQLARFSDACGAEIPRWMRVKFESFRDDTASIRAFGLDVVTALCEKLLAAGAPGLHFYTLNQAGPTTAIWQRLGL